MSDESKTSKTNASKTDKKKKVRPAASPVGKPRMDDDPPGG